MDDKAKELLEQKKANDQGGELKKFVENQVEGSGRNVPSDIEATKGQVLDQQNRLKDQENRTASHTGDRGADPKV
ncbi:MULTISPECIES: hypothetical protein [Saccharibacillus]|uniref:Uncharacterized protein n=1 Tax=Saccharibacillus brassicae TaxID=2583377 RepID=A0A4Y6UXI1_SACBS|nr:MULTISPECIES: hypothetical protein [Saccharibacillus]MWJ31083.1 hypothetical protein [Saccharibacillus sp. WB 17]QDH22433.1 hypothetical protein FFV09_17255 [Saccharibacillus brassicae]